MRLMFLIEGNKLVERNSALWTKVDVLISTGVDIERESETAQHALTGRASDSVDQNQRRRKKEQQGNFHPIAGEAKFS